MSFPVFWQKRNFILPFAVNVMLNLSTESRSTAICVVDCFLFDFADPFLSSEIIVQHLM